MDIIVVGGGGREHAIIKKLRENSEIDKIYALPGNGGIAQEAQCVDISATDIDGIVDFAIAHNIGFAVVAPDDPLVMGAVDRLHGAGIPCFGPSANAAIIEGSKAFAKELMKENNIPTAAYDVFDSSEAAVEYVRNGKFPIVIKADGLALGKGVVIANTFTEAEEAIRSAMVDGKFGKSGSRIVIEEFLTGNEVSVLAFTDGKSIIPLVPSMDHKRALDGDKGLNTGGMGAIAPNPYYTEEIAEECMNRIFMPTVKAMNALGKEFKGCLYFGLMITSDGPKVIEYNCRFGDPETQAVLPLLKTDLFTIMRAVEDERLEEVKVELSDRSSCCLVLASDGYPLAYEKGNEITIGDISQKDVYVFHAGTKQKDGRIVTSGGRVIGVTAIRDTLAEAITAAYDAAEHICFENKYSRRDIGESALSAIKNRGAL